MSYPKELIRLKTDLHTRHPMQERLHQWHWRFRMGQANPMEAVWLLEELRGFTWTPDEQIEGGSAWLSHGALTDAQPCEGRQEERTRSLEEDIREHCPQLSRLIDQIVERTQGGRDGGGRNASFPAAPR